MVVVRRAVEDDWEQSRAIRLRALRDAPLAFASTYERELAFGPEQWRQRIATSVQFLAVPEVGDVIGTVTALPDPDRSATMLLVAMFVTPPERRSGVGERLVQAVIAQARVEGAQEVRLHVVETNHGARRLYERSGFVRTGATMRLPHRPTLLEQEMVLSLDVEEAGSRQGHSTAGRSLDRNEVAAGLTEQATADRVRDSSGLQVARRRLVPPDEWVLTWSRRALVGGAD